GVIGLGMRGPGAVDRLSKIQDVEITALCDIYENKVNGTQNILKRNNRPEAKAFFGSKEAWKKMCELDLDLVYICTPWEDHVPMAVYAMEHGSHAAVEVPVATTMEECWQMVEVSEKTQKHCVILENCCYDFFELLTLNMAREGVFGELTHGEGAYIHELGSWMMPNGGHDKSAYQGNWRYFHNTKSGQPNKLKDGNPYATHGMGPLAQCMNVNRGNKVDYMVSMSSQEAAFTTMAKELNRPDFINKHEDYRGDMNTSLLKLNGGQTIMIQHDVSTPRPYSRIHLLQGSKGIARKWPNPARIALRSHHGGHQWLNSEEFKAINEKYGHPLSKEMGSIARKVGGHGGMDFIMDYRLIYSLKNGLPMDMDVYDAAVWSAITPLSYQSCAKKSTSFDFPDFTRGAWKTNKPLEIVTVDQSKLPVVGQVQSNANQLNVQ
ncbi:MAG: Gfo/Idh/MocA family protein, partial [Lentisphaeria bacterium]